MRLPRFPKLWCMVSHTPFLFLEARILLCRNPALLSKHQKAPSSLDVSWVTGRASNADDCS